MSSAEFLHCMRSLKESSVESPYRLVCRRKISVDDTLICSILFFSLISSPFLLPQHPAPPTPPTLLLLLLLFSFSRFANSNYHYIVMQHITKTRLFIFFVNFT